MTDSAAYQKWLADKSDAEVERLKALLRKDVVAINERDVAEGMEQAAVIAEGHGPGDTEACIAAVIRAKINK